MSARTGVKVSYRKTTKQSLLSSVLTGQRAHQHSVLPASSTLATSLSSGQYTARAEIPPPRGLTTRGRQQHNLVHQPESPLETVQDPCWGWQGMTQERKCAPQSTSHSHPPAASLTAPMPLLKAPPPHGTPNSISRTAPLNLQRSPGRPVYILNSEKSLFRLAVIWKVIKSDSILYVISFFLLALEKGLLPSIQYF